MKKKTLQHPWKHQKKRQKHPTKKTQKKTNFKNSLKHNQIKKMQTYATLNEKKNDISKLSQKSTKLEHKNSTPKNTQKKQPFLKIIKKSLKIKSTNFWNSQKTPIYIKDKFWVFLWKTPNHETLIINEYSIKIKQKKHLPDNNGLKYTRHNNNPAYVFVAMMITT